MAGPWSVPTAGACFPLLPFPSPSLLPSCPMLCGAGSHLDLALPLASPAHATAAETCKVTNLRDPRSHQGTQGTQELAQPVVLVLIRRIHHQSHERAPHPRAGQCLDWVFLVLGTKLWSGWTGAAMPGAGPSTTLHSVQLARLSWR